MTEQQLRKIIREELERIGSGDSGTVTVDDSGPDLAPETVDFLSELAEEAYGGVLGLRPVSTRAKPTGKAWTQVELRDDPVGRGQELAHVTFLTLERLDPDVYRLSADASTRSPSGIEEEHMTYITFRSEDPPTPADINRSLVQAVADMIEDAEMEGFIS